MENLLRSNVYVFFFMCKLQVKNSLCDELTFLSMCWILCVLRKYWLKWKLNSFQGYYTFYPMKRIFIISASLVMDSVLLVLSCFFFPVLSFIIAVIFCRCCHEFFLCSVWSFTCFVSHFYSWIIIKIQTFQPPQTAYYFSIHSYSFVRTMVLLRPDFWIYQWRSVHILQLE